MAERAEESKQEELRSVAELTTEIVVAYLTRNTIAVADLGDLIGTVCRALEALGRETARARQTGAGRSGAPLDPRRAPHRAWSAASSRKPFGAISTSRTSSRRKPTASSSGSSPTTPWRHRATPGSVPRWPSASAWDSAFRRHHDAGSRAATPDPSTGWRIPRSLATHFADDLHVRSGARRSGSAPGPRSWPRPE